MSAHRAPLPDATLTGYAEATNYAQAGVLWGALTGALALGVLVLPTYPGLLTGGAAILTGTLTGAYLCAAAVFAAQAALGYRE